MALFPRWSNGLFRLILALGLAGIAAVPLLLMAWVRTPYVTGQYVPVDQPVEFDHRHHARDDGIDCLYCHNLAERSPFAGVPATEVCLNCHNQIWNDSPLLEPVRESWFEGRPIAWRRVHRLPDFVFFDHSIHVNRGVGCVSCHGRVDLMARVYQVAPLTMGWCLDCHRDPAPHLRPPDRITDMEWTPGEGARLAIGGELARRHDVRPGVTCTSCHR